MKYLHVKYSFLRVVLPKHTTPKRIRSRKFRKGFVIGSPAKLKHIQLPHSLLLTLNCYYLTKLHTFEEL